MNKAEQILEFDKIKELWRSFAFTEAAQTKIKTAIPCLSESELQIMLRETTQARQLIETCGNPPLTSFSGIKEILDTAQKEGCLLPEQLETIGTNLTAIRRLKDYLNRGKLFQLSLAYYEENLDSCDTLREEIQKQIRGGAVDDYATPLLHSIRKKLDLEQTKMREKAEQILRTNKTYMADQFTTTRNGRICLPVKKEYRHKINGSVLDKSSTGSTFFVEPTAVAKHFEELQLLKIDELNEEMRIRYTLTSMVLESFPQIQQNMDTVIKLDFAFSKGKLSLEYGGAQPQINTNRRIHLREARHPLLERNSCIPLSLDMGNEIRGIVITGPNTGGKTVAIKTAALCCMMAQCGLHVPCVEADLCMNANYLCDIGDGQNISENLSTFSAHLKRILDILASLTPESLVILDELGSGTDPAEGMGIAIAVLDELLKCNALFLVTTHYPEVKQYAQNTPAILNARMDFDKENLRPLYRLIIGESGESCAFSIAKRLGMSDKMLERAAQAAYDHNYKKHLPEAREQTACGQNYQNPLLDLPEHEKSHWKDSNNSPNAKCTYSQDNGSDTNRVHPRTAASHPKILKKKTPATPTSAQTRAHSFHLGDSVIVYPDKKIGIVCKTANEKGILQIQLPNRKIWINHKRIKLHVPATELYPEDYDFSIIFDSVENRKLRHQMERKYVEGATIETI